MTASRLGWLLGALVALALALSACKTKGRAKPAAGGGHGSSGGAEVASRYAETDGVAIDAAKVPEDLHDLLPLARKWAIGDDVERDEFQKGVSFEEKKAFVDAVWLRMARIEEWCSGLRGQAPVPDEVVLFDMMAEAAAEVYYEVYPKGTKEQ